MVDKTRLLLVAADVGESQLLKGLVAALGDSEFVCTTFLGEGVTPFPFSQQEIGAAVSASDIVLVAISENNESAVFAALAAAFLKKPVVIVALSYRSWAFPAFADVRKHVHTLFVLNDDEAERARLLYPHASIVPTGNPEWENFFFPTRTREEVRTLLSVAPEQKLVVISGEKEPAINFPLAVCVIEALRTLPNFRVVFTIHPGHFPIPGTKEPSPTPEELIEFYRSLEGNAAGVDVRVSCRGVPFGFGTPDMVVGADLVVGTNSNEQLRAAALRIPSIAVLLREAFRGRTLPEHNGGWWYPCDSGAVEAIYGLDSGAVRYAAYQLLSGTNWMHEDQERIFPRPEKVGDAHEKIRQTLLHIAR